MLISMVLLMAAAGVWVQSTPPGGEALKKFQEKAEASKMTPPKVCSIPLLQARPAPAEDPKMAIAPKAGVRFQIREVIPPAPVCGANVRWK